MTNHFRIEPLAAKIWPEFERLFGRRGACAGCWCKYWKLARKDFDALVHEGNCRAQKAIVESAAVPSLLAYNRTDAIGSIAVQRRSEYPRLARSRVLKPVDDEPLLSITCFVVDPRHRQRGMTIEPVRAAICDAKERGGTLLEGYPVESDGKRLPAASAYAGLVWAFRNAGSKEAARNSSRRPIFRSRIGG